MSTEPAPEATPPVLNVEDLKALLESALKQNEAMKMSLGAIAAYLGVHPDYDRCRIRLESLLKLERLFMRFMNELITQATPPENG